LKIFKKISVSLLNIYRLCGTVSFYIRDLKFLCEVWYLWGSRINPLWRETDRERKREKGGKKEGERGREEGREA
jgi:hypothetical protein